MDPRAHGIEQIDRRNPKAGTLDRMTPLHKGQVKRLVRQVFGPHGRLRTCFDAAGRPGWAVIARTRDTHEDTVLAEVYDAPEGVDVTEHGLPFIAFTKAANRIGYVVERTAKTVELRFPEAVRAQLEAAKVAAEAAKS